MMAPMVLDGPINRLAFQAYVEQALVPEFSTGDIVVMDNLSSTKALRCAKPSRQQERVCSTFRPTALTSLPSRTPLPS